MATRKRERIANMIKGELTDAMVRAGHIPHDPLAERNEDAFWFTTDTAGIPNTVAAVQALIGYSRDGAVRCTGTVFLISPTVGGILRSMPADALLKGRGPDSSSLEYVDYRFFNELPAIELAGMAPWVITETDVPIAVQWFERRVSGAVATWFDDRHSLERLTRVAEEPIPGSSHDRIYPDVLRATIVLCIVNGYFAEAAELMTAHLGRDHVQPNIDSFERAAAFDRALADRFPEYRRARGH